MELPMPQELEGETVHLMTEDIHRLVKIAALAIKRLDCKLDGI